MNCAELREQTDLWLAGQLTDGAARQLEAHAASCPACEVWLDQASAIPQLPREIVPPVHLKRDTLAAVAQRRAQRKLRRSVVGTAGIAAAVLIAMLARPTEKSASDFPGAGKALLAMKLAKPEFDELDRAEAEIRHALADVPTDATLSEDLRRIRQQRATLQELVRTAPE